MTNPNGAQLGWMVIENGKWEPMCELCFHAAHPGRCANPAGVAEYWRRRAAGAREDADRFAMRAALAEAVETRQDFEI